MEHNPKETEISWIDNEGPIDANDDKYNEIDDSDLVKQQSYKHAQERYKQNTEHRRFLVNWVVFTNSSWLIAVIVIIIAHGAICEDGKNLFHLPEGVMITLLATTTANVLGLALIVLRGLFEEDKKHQ